MLARHVLVAALGVAVTAAAVPATVQAQKSKPATDKKAAAKQYVDAGIAAEKTGDYDTAITMYEKAFELIPHPVLLFNIGNAHRAAGRVIEALEHYEKYLAADPKGDKVKAATQAIQEIEPEVEKARAELERKANAEEEAKAEAERKAKEEAEKEEVEEDENEDQKGEGKGKGQSARGGWSGMRIAGVVSLGLGAISLGGGVAFGLKAKGISDDFSRPEAEWDADRYAEGQAAERTMYIAYGVGAGLVVAGAVLFVLGAESSVTPTVDDDSAGVALSGRF